MGTRRSLVLRATYDTNFYPRSEVKGSTTTTNAGYWKMRNDSGFLPQEETRKWGINTKIISRKELLILRNVLREKERK